MGGWAVRARSGQTGHRRPRLPGRGRPGPGRGCQAVTECRQAAAACDAQTAGLGPGPDSRERASLRESLAGLGPSPSPPSQCRREGPRGALARAPAQWQPRPGLPQCGCHRECEYEAH
jgi:hypothetical protein